MFSWSATGVRPGVAANFTINTTIVFQESSDNVHGTGLWNESMYGSRNDDGSGEQYQLNEQILSITQQNTDLTGTRLDFIGSEAQLDITELGCDKDFQYLCFSFMKGANPSVAFDLNTFQGDGSRITVCNDRCPSRPGLFIH